VTEEELVILLKFGTKKNAIAYWKDETATDRERLYELNIVQRWENPKVPKLRRPKK